MNKEKTEYILRILQRVFEDGYRPARGNESYYKKINNGLYVGNMVNCMGHIFNLRNQQFDDYKIEPYKLFSHGYAHPYFMGFMKGANKHDESAKLMLDFIKEVGLKVEECSPIESIKDFKSWKIALYFSSNDFHYLLEDSPQNWSGKVGNKSIVEHVEGIKLPMQYQNRVDTFPSIYNFYGTYKITNENADENNKYVMDRE